MIPRSDSTLETSNWQNQLKNMVTDPSELCRLLALNYEQQQALEAACGVFPLKVPPSYLARIEPGNPADPLLKQILPSAMELHRPPGYCPDPLEETVFNPVPGLIHKYHGRVLLITTSSCPIHCRYCFRRHFPYSENRNSRTQWQKALEYIGNETSISEVILSGGDPLSCSDDHLEWLCLQIEALTHIKRLRIHTRFPIVIPQRITPECLNWLTARRLQVCMVLHCNHPREIDETVYQHLRTLSEANILLLNQSVLLKGVNNCHQTLTSLSERLYEANVIPYYLHLLDRVEGASHFDVPEDEAIRLHRAMQAKLPGYLVPKLVREEARQSSKTPIPAL